MTQNAAQPIYEWSNGSITALLCYDCAFNHPSEGHGTTVEISNEEINARYAGVVTEIFEGCPVYCDNCKAPMWGRSEDDPDLQWG